jgi:hypothetical protein
MSDTSNQRQTVERHEPNVGEIHYVGRRLRSFVEWLETFDPSRVVGIAQDLMRQNPDVFDCDMLSEINEAYGAPFDVEDVTEGYAALVCFAHAADMYTETMLDLLRTLSGEDLRWCYEPLAWMHGYIEDKASDLTIHNLDDAGDPKEDIEVVGPKVLGYLRRMQSYLPSVMTGSARVQTLFVTLPVHAGFYSRDQAGEQMNEEEPRVAPDFSSITCRCGDFTFSKAVRPIFQALYEDWLKTSVPGRPCL